MLKINEVKNGVCITSLVITTLTISPISVYADELEFEKISFNTSGSIWSDTDSQAIDWSYYKGWKSKGSKRLFSSTPVDLNLIRDLSFGAGIRASFDTGTANAGVSFTPTLNSFDGTKLGEAFQLNGSLNNFSNELSTRLAPPEVAIMGKFYGKVQLGIDGYGSCCDTKISLLPRITTNGYQELLSTNDLTNVSYTKYGSNMNFGLGELTSSNSSSNSTVTSNGSLKLMHGVLDIDGLITAVTRVPELEDEYRSSFVDVDYNILDFDFHNRLQLEQKFSLKSTVDTKLSFSQDVLINGNVTNNWTGDWEQLPEIKLLDLNPVEVTPIFNLDTQLTNITSLGFNAYFRSKGPSLSVNIGSIAGIYNPPEVSFSPLWDWKAPKPEIDIDVDLFRSSFSLGKTQQVANSFTLQSTASENFLGDDQDNILFGDNNNNILYGEGGNDTLYALDGNDILSGGFGQDTLNGGEGIDTVSYRLEGTENNGFNVDLIRGSSKQLGTNSSEDTLVDIENIIASRYNDELYGDDSTNHLQGLAGDDYLHGRKGDDQLYGGDGNDYLNGGVGNDLLDGGSGDDTYAWYNTYSNQDRVVDSSGNDTLVYGTDVETDGIVVTAINQNNLNVQLSENNSVTIENQYGASVAIETMRSKSTIQSFNLNMSFEQLVGSGQFSHYGIEGEYTTGDIISNVNNLNIKGELNNQHILINQGKINVAANGAINNAAGILNNQQGGEVNFSDSSLLAGLIINNGLINIADEQVLTLKGELFGTGTYSGDTLLDGASVNPGNSPGTLTFNGDSYWNNVDLTMEVASAVGGGIEFDTINILGNLTLLSAFTIDFDFLDGLDVSTLLGESLNFINVGGSVFDIDGYAINLADWALILMDGWASSWSQDSDNNWQLALTYEGIADSPTSVPEPSSLILFLLAGFGLLHTRKTLTKNI